MRNLGTIIIGAVLVASIATGAMLYSRLNNQLATARLDIATLQTNTAPTTTTPPTGGSNMTMIDLITRVQPVVVRVDVEGASFAASGSGVIIRSDGHVMTNNHVVENTTSITVTLSDDRHFPATIVSSDANLDLAIIKLTGAPSNLPAAELGTPGDVVVGGIVVAAGFPLGSALPGPASFTQGIVSAIRQVNGQPYIQSDVVINPGNSGGALVTRSTGRLIGITSARVIQDSGDVEGINLAIPIDVMLSYIQANLN